MTLITKNTKTILFASLIAAIILPFSVMGAHVTIHLVNAPHELYKKDGRHSNEQQ